MSVDTLPEKTGFSGRSPRISFSNQLVLSSQDKHTTAAPVQNPSTDFDFGTWSREHESSTADELFSDGKLIPLLNVVRRPTPKSKKSTNAAPSSPQCLGKEESTEDSGKMIIMNDETDDNKASKSFWKVMRSRSFGGSGRSLCTLPLLSRSNSTGSPLDCNKLPNPQKSNVAAPSFPKLSQKPLPRKSASGNNGNNVRVESFGMHWISNFVIGLCFLSVVNKFGISSVYLGFSAVCVLAVLYIASNVVETKGRSLEEIELALSNTS